MVSLTYLKYKYISGLPFKVSIGMMCMYINFHNRMQK